MTARQIIKKIVGENYWRFLMWHYKTFGLINLPMGLMRFVLNRNLVKVKINDKYTINVRPGTTDMDVFSEIFINKELDLDFGEPEFIIDAGAHIGCAAVWLAILYPKAKILAVEPEASNYKILLENTIHYPNITCINAGVWSHKALLQIKNRECDNWSFIVEEAKDTNINTIEAISISDILNRFHWKQIDVLKIDIEGSEIEVMSTSKEWIHSVKILIIELHDRFRPGCKSALENAIRGHNFEVKSAGEKKILRNISHIS